MAKFELLPLEVNIFKFCTELNWIINNTIHALLGILNIKMPVEKNLPIAVLILEYQTILWIKFKGFRHKKIN